LLRPPLLVPVWSDSGPLTPPIGPAYLAASLRQAGHRVRIVDGLGESPFQVTPLFGGRILGIGLRSEEIVERIEPDTELVGVSCMFSQDWPEIRRLIQLVRQRFPSVPIVAGGEHITATAAFTLASTPEVGVCVVGEGEETLVELAAAISSGAALDGVRGLVIRTDDGGSRSTGPRTRIRALDEIPWPAWNLVPLNRYLDHGLGYGVNRGRSMPMLATRGCPYECTFCSSPEMWTTRWYARSPESVLDEIRAYQDRYGATNFDFFDLTAIVKRSWIVQFTQLILDRGMHFTWQLPSGTRSEAIDAEVSRLLFVSGCRNVSYAPESGSPEVLKRIKKVVKLERLEASVVEAVRAGLNVKLNIIMGFPDESRRELGQTVRFLIRMAIAGVHDMSVSLFSPYPGSALYHDLRAVGRIPELSDEYFLGLCAYKDFAQSVSYTDGLSPAVLNLYRIAGFVGFYGIQYLVRPWRLVRLILNLAHRRQESRLDKSLQDFANRVLNARHAKAMPEAVPADVEGTTPPPRPAPSRGITVLIPARPGDESIDSVIESVRPYADEVLVLDAAARLSAPNLGTTGARLVQGRGLDSADAMRAALAEGKTDILVFVDPSCSHNPSDIAKLAAPIEAGECDLVIASRARGGSDERHGTFAQFVRYMGEQLVTLAINYRWKVRLTDSQNGFRAIRRSVAERLDLSWNVNTMAQETVMKALKRHYRVGEVPSHEYERPSPASKSLGWKLAAIHLWAFLSNLR
jgi:radical SAM superfamily enzyme YgiQ (UPF0313 family)